MDLSSLLYLSELLRDRDALSVEANRFTVIMHYNKHTLMLLVTWPNNKVFNTALKYIYHTYHDLYTIYIIFQACFFLISFSLFYFSSLEVFFASLIRAFHPGLNVYMIQWENNSKQLGKTGKADCSKMYFNINRIRCGHKRLQWCTNPPLLVLISTHSCSLKLECSHSLLNF